MNKAKKHELEHLKDHQPSFDQTISGKSGNKKSKKSADLHNPKDISGKQQHGHFTQQHIWPVPNEKKSGRRRF